MVIKLIYIKNIKHIETTYQLYWNKVKKKYGNDYFRNKNNNINKKWKGTKWIVSWKSLESESLKVILNNKSEFLTNSLPNSLMIFFVPLHLLFNPI